MSHHQQHLTIGAVAQLTGVSAQAIRYYERIGLLPRPVRQPNGYRLYSEMDVKRVLLLARVRSLGTPLSAAKPLVTEADHARCADVQGDLLALAQARLGEIDAEIAALHQSRVEVATFARTLASFTIVSDQPFAECADVRCVTQPERCTPSRKEEDAMKSFAHEDCDCCNGTCDCGCCKTA
jgi:DNA-binding transcriptional MerR regulator